MAGWEVPLGIVLTIFGGFALAIQAGVNSSLGNSITKPMACKWQAGWRQRAARRHGTRVLESAAPSQGSLSSPSRRLRA